jgi:FdhD protein
VAGEEPLEIRIVAWSEGRWLRHQIAVTMRTPGNDFELAAGFLLTEGVVSDASAIKQIAYCASRKEAERHNVVNVFLDRDVKFDPARLSRHVYTTSSCGVCGKTSLESVRAVCPQEPRGTVRLPGPYFLGLPEKLRHAQPLFDRTGGLHASALFDAEGQLILVREDVGRHNAMDKLIGALLQSRRLPASNTVVLVSGRASFELVQKGLMAGIPILAAVGAPTSLAVELATECGMTLVGFLRGDRFNVYSGPERILV